MYLRHCPVLFYTLLLFILQPMSIPFFYKKDIALSDTSVVLDEDTSKHVVQVLRMQNEELIRLTDGAGTIFTAAIADNHRKKCVVTVIEKTTISLPSSNVCLAISPVKNNSRYEWFLEKATEIGVRQIIPLICERTEKQHFKWERMNAILISAMLQSQQSWLPVLQEPQKFASCVSNNTLPQKLVAHCVAEANKKTIAQLALQQKEASIILIGPEGDFSAAEIELALANQFIPVSLGETRLRTETAGIVAATLLVNMG
jgi:16S rRNA (uracil1498-N3)-methyltransferase